VPALAAAACCAALLATGCSGPADSIAAAVYDAKLPYVHLVDVSPKNPFEGKDYEDVYIYLSADVTDEQVAHLWCDVVLPAGPDRLSPGSVHLWRGEHTAMNGAVSGVDRLDIPTCQASSPHASPG
jgi:hypothetical protein